MGDKQGAFWLEAISVCCVQPCRRIFVDLRRPRRWCRRRCLALAVPSPRDLSTKLGARQCKGRQLLCHLLTLFVIPAKRKRRNASGSTLLHVRIPRIPNASSACPCFFWLQLLLPPPPPCSEKYFPPSFTSVHCTALLVLWSTHPVVPVYNSQDFFKNDRSFAG